MSEIVIVGGGICGLSLALNLHRQGIACRVSERAPEVKELGVGITLLPHATREFTALGLADEILAAGIENVESCFFNRFGQLIYKEPRGKFAGYPYPEDAVAFAGINTWRGVTRRKPILTGRSYIRVGSILTGKIVIYPIVDDVDGEGNQLINWMAEIQGDTFDKNDWNQAGKIEDFHHIYAGWRFDWLDVADLIAKADSILEYPMVDKDPIERWTFGRITLAGDAAHPMYPRGSNGAAQAAIDARTLAECIRSQPDARAALKGYEEVRLPATA